MVQDTIENKKNLTLPGYHYNYVDQKSLTKIRFHNETGLSLSFFQRLAVHPPKQYKVYVLIASNFELCRSFL